MIYAEVDDADREISRLKRSQLHQPPYPIHRSTVIFILTKDKKICFQRRSIALRLFPAHLDLVGGHVPACSSYEAVAASELEAEFPVSGIATRLKRLPAPQEPFFRVRTAHNNENRGVFVVALQEAEERELHRWNERLKGIWHEVIETVASERGVSSVELRRQVHTNPYETYGDTLQHQLQQAFGVRLQNIPQEQQRILELAREVECYEYLSLEDALSSRERGDEKFADGFAAFVDPILNGAAEAHSYLSAVAVAIRGANSVG